MLLTPAEVSQRLRVSLRMVYALMADGSITADSSALLYACLRCGSAAQTKCTRRNDEQMEDGPGRADGPNDSRY